MSQGSCVFAEEGAIVVSVHRDGARCWRKGPAWGPVWIVGLYQAIRRVRDGVLTWRLVDNAPGTYSVLATAEKQAATEAQSRGLTWAHVRHGDMAEEG